MEKELSTSEITRLLLVIVVITFINLYFVGNIANIVLTIIQVLYVLFLVVRNKYQDALLWHLIFVLTSVSGTNAVGIESIDSDYIYNYARLKIAGPIGLSYCVILLLLILSFTNKRKISEKLLYNKLFKLFSFACVSGFLIGFIGFFIDDYNTDGIINYGIYITIVLVTMKCLMNLYSIEFVKKISRYLEIVLSGALLATVINYMTGGVTTTYGVLGDIILTPDISNYGIMLLFCFFVPHNKSRVARVFILMGIISFAYIILTTSNGKVLISIAIALIILAYILITSDSYSKRIKASAIVFVCIAVGTISQMSIGDLTDQKAKQAASIFSGDVNEIEQSPYVRFGTFCNLAYEAIYNPIFLVFGHGYGGYFKDNLGFFAQLNLHTAFSDKDAATGHYHSAHDTYCSVPLNNGFIILFILLYISFLYIKRTKIEPYAFAAVPWLVLTFYFNTQTATCGLLFLYASEYKFLFLNMKSKKIKLKHFNSPWRRSIAKYSTFIFLFLLSSSYMEAQETNNYRNKLKNADIKIESTNLPIVFIESGGQMILRDDYILANMKIIHNGEGELNYGDTILHNNQHIDYDGYIALKYRGHSSFNYSDKKPYAFRTLKNGILPIDGGEKKKVSLLGMRKDSKWAMLAPWSDRSMIRDVLSFDLARPWMDFVPDTRFCEIVLDGTYCGIYILTERVSQGKNRLNLKDSKEIGNDGETDILVYIDRGDDSGYESLYHPYGINGINVEKKIIYEYIFPEEKDFSVLPEKTKDYVNSEIDRMEESFLTSYYQDPSIGYRTQVDVMSFIDYMLSAEVSNNIDGYRLSTYLYRYCNTHAGEDGCDSRWKMSLWDYNFAWGNSKYNGHVSNTMWHYDINFRKDYQNDKNWVPFYWHRMLNDSLYVEQLKKRWHEYRNSNHSNESIEFKVDSLTTLLQLGGALTRNEEAWQIFTSNIWGVGYSVNSYSEEIAHLKNWIVGRLAFMDKELSESTTALYDAPKRVNKVANPKFYNLKGVEINSHASGGIFIDGNNKRKMIIKKR